MDLADTKFCYKCKEPIVLCKCTAVSASDSNDLLCENREKKVEDFLHRTIAVKSEDVFTDKAGMDLHIEATRTRTSNGFSSIKISIGFTVVEFNSERLGDNYEQAAKAFAECLDKACDNPCVLPKFKGA